jgi:hypothetical protein
MAQEAVVQAKAVGTITVALHQAGRRASPPAMSVGAAARCRSKPKKEHAHITQDEEEASLMLLSAILIRPEVISSSAEVEIH